MIGIKCCFNCDCCPYYDERNSGKFICALTDFNNTIFMEDTKYETCTCEKQQRQEDIQTYCCQDPQIKC